MGGLCSRWMEGLESGAARQLERPALIQKGTERAEDEEEEIAEEM